MWNAVGLTLSQMVVAIDRKLEAFSLVKWQSDTHNRVCAKQHLPFCNAETEKGWKLILPLLIGDPSTKEFNRAVYIYSSLTLQIYNLSSLSQNMYEKTNIVKQTNKSNNF